MRVFRQITMLGMLMSLVMWQHSVNAQEEPSNEDIEDQDPVDYTIPEWIRGSVWHWNEWQNVKFMHSGVSPQLYLPLCSGFAVIDRAFRPQGDSGRQVPNATVRTRNSNVLTKSKEIW